MCMVLIKYNHTIKIQENESEFHQKTEKSEVFPREIQYVTICVVNERRNSMYNMGEVRELPL